MIHKLIYELDALFSKQTNTAISSWQRAYMKHRYDFFGIQKPQRAALQKVAFKKHTINTLEELSAIVMTLWNKEEREYHYAAIDLLLLHKKLWNHHTLALFEYCIITNSWWDTVDTLASHCIGTLCIEYPEIMTTMDTWINHENIWLRRTALIFQLKYKKNTDTQRLFSYCEKRMHEKEFFIRKAIGWALREYSKTNPTAIAQFVAKNNSLLSPLSKREAIKHLP